ncbi:MAG TPA: outer membrane protein assembly factor BamA [Blastocatellia bacterium]|nr:outer membrane protein assembly factor BamA [Blastocatellia bacterium]
MVIGFRLVAVLLAIFLWVAAAPRTTRAQGEAPQDLIEDIEIRGNRRIPRETVLYSIQSKPGDIYNEAAIKRDFNSVLGIGVFDPMAAKLEIANGPRGGKIIIFELKEYPLIREMQYRHLKAATESEILTRFKERHLAVSKETPFDPVKAHGAGRVLRELLAEKGYPDAAVEVEVEDISATSVGLVFVVTEGPRVRIREIEFTGDYHSFSQRRLRKAMQLVKEAGMLSSFTSKDIYFRDKLSEDLERIRFFLNTKGYLQAKIGEPKITPDGIASNGFPLPVPILRKSGPGLKISIPVETGRRYKISKVEEKGVAIFQPGIVTAVSGQKIGEWADAKLIQDNVFKGIKDLYGTQGYIQASVDFVPKFIDKTEEEGEVEITLEIDEGRQFTLRRLEFIGNIHTRDKILRREVMLNEGDPYNKRSWDLSILRLNQLGLFDEIKEKDAITRTNDRDQTVDLDLQVKERGRQQIQLNGGVSGYTGSFFGISYSTNNLFGFGQTLSLGLSGGNRQLSASVGFTEPYFLGKPISAGFELFAQSQKYFGNNYNTFSNFYSTSNLSQVDLDELFTQKTAGGSVSLSAPLYLFTRRFREFGRFARVGLSYSLTTSRIEDPEVNTDDDTSNDIPVTYSQPRILISRITPSLFYNTLNSAIDPTRGQSLTLGLSIAGGALGGDVKLLSPNFEYKYFRPLRRKDSDRPHVLGVRFSLGHVRTFGKLADKLVNTQSLGFVGGIPITERYFLGGENDVRGYNVSSISPVSRYDFYNSTRNVVAKVSDSSGNLIDIDDGSIQSATLRQYTYDAPTGLCAAQPTPSTCNVNRIVREDSDGNEIPFYTAVGGDTRLLMNVEYRIPIAGPVSLASFLDVGTVFNLRKYNDQIVTTNFVNQTLTPNGLIINPNGSPITAADRDFINSYEGELINGLPPGYRQIYLQGDARSYNLLLLSKSDSGILDSLRASLGMEFRVQVPFINVPFRLIFAYNPMANPDITNPKILSLEKRTVMKFSIGRTF